MDNQRSRKLTFLSYGFQGRIPELQYGRANPLACRKGFNCYNMPM
jgi:hypothetical protein